MSFFFMINIWLAGWVAAGWLLVGWLAGWLLAGWLAGGLAGWLAAGWLAGWLAAGWLADCWLSGWLACCWLARWLAAGWLAGCWLPECWLSPLYLQTPYHSKGGFIGISMFVSTRGANYAHLPAHYNHCAVHAYCVAYILQAHWRSMRMHYRKNVLSLDSDAAGDC